MMNTVICSLDREKKKDQNSSEDTDNTKNHE